MSATHSPSQSISHSNGDAAPAVPSVEIDASCRAPLLLMFASAAIWLLIGSLLGIVATLKFHMPNFLSDCASMTYGRVHPAHLNAFIYGFAIQAGWEFYWWIVAHLGRTRLALTPAIIAGTIMWNLGMLLGILGILLGTAPVLSGSKCPAMRLSSCLSVIWELDWAQPKLLASVVNGSLHFTLVYDRGVVLVSLGLFNRKFPARRQTGSRGHASCARLVVHEQSVHRLVWLHRRGRDSVFHPENDQASAL